jgi:SAM-dependent methyltransferase
MSDSIILRELYSKISKHSHYQKLPEALKYLINDDLPIKSRYEDERFAYMIKNIAIEDKIVLDIGANTGYFAFELINKGARCVHVYEGNKDHADFIKYAANVIHLNKEIIVKNEYFDFSDINRNINCDIILLLNVLHHIGDDYGDTSITLEKAKQSIVNSINTFISQTSILIFQFGFNWKGDRNRPLFSTGSKSEMIDFIKEYTLKNWDIINIGIPVLINNTVEYTDVDEHNIHRYDNLGEFLNRPLFILKSKQDSSCDVVTNYQLITPPP